MSDSVAIVQSGLTAVTAYCALRAVQLGREQWATAKHPDVHLQVLHPRIAGTTDLALVNVGGWARGVLVAMSVGDQQASGYISTSILAHGERVYVHTELPQCGDARVLVMFRGMDETTYRVVRGKAREKLSEDRGRPGSSLSAEWSAVYPGDDWHDKKQVPMTVRDPAA